MGETGEEEILDAQIAEPRMVGGRPGRHLRNNGSGASAAEPR